MTVTVSMQERNPGPQMPVMCSYHILATTPWALELDGGSRRAQVSTCKTHTLTLVPEHILTFQHPCTIGLPYRWCSDCRMYTTLSPYSLHSSPAMQEQSIGTKASCARMALRTGLCTGVALGSTLALQGNAALLG